MSRMPRLKIRKSNRGIFSPETMEEAVKDVLQHKTTILAASKAHGVNRMTLSRYVCDAKKAMDEKTNTMCFKKSHVTNQVSYKSYMQATSN